MCEETFKSMEKIKFLKIPNNMTIHRNWPNWSNKYEAHLHIHGT